MYAKFVAFATGICFIVLIWLCCSRFHGSEDKIQRAAVMVENYLLADTKYTNKDINKIVGAYTWISKDCKYGHW